MFRHLIILFVSVLIITSGTGAAFAQSESYIDTIYQALESEQGTSQESSAPQGEDNGDGGEQSVTIETDDEEAVVEQTEELPPEIQRINTILNDITRILTGQLGGALPTLNLIDLSDTGSQTQTETETNTETETVTDTNTDTDTDTVTDTDTDTSTDTVTDTDTDTDTDTNTDTVTDTSTDTVTVTDTDTNTQTETETVTQTETETETVTQTETETQTNTSTDTSTVDGLKNSISDKYDIDMGDGTADWSLKQLEAADELFATLPKGFLDCTTKITRDVKVEENTTLGSATNILGYVKYMEQEVHILDLATEVSEDTQELIEDNMREAAREAYIKTYKEKYNEDPPEVLITEYVDGYVERNLAAQIEYQFKFQLKHTIAHEMTHCLQHTYPNVYREWQAKFWPNNEITGDSPSNYGKSLPYEDMAESFAFFILGGRIEDGFFITETGSKMDLERYEFVKNALNELGGNY